MLGGFKNQEKESDNDAVGDLIEKIIEKPKTVEIKKKIKLDKDLIKQIQLGGKTIDDESNRPFWEFPKIEYPYDHFVPAFIMIFGQKGSGKSSIALSVPGNILGITFEKRGNLLRPWTKIFTNADRMQLFGVSEYINRTTMASYRDTSNEVYLKVCKLLNRARILERKFDWVLIDGLQATQKLSTLRMKKLNDIGAFDNLPTKKLTKWGERTVYLENLVIDLASSVSTKGVIITSQNVEHKAMFLTKEEIDAGMKEEDIPVKEPAWKEKVKDDVDTIMYTEMVEKKLGANRSMIKRYVTVTSNKLGGGEGKHNITLQDDNQATKKLIETLLTSDLEFEPIE